MKQIVDNIVKGCFYWFEMIKEQYLCLVGLEGVIFVGSFEVVVYKIIGFVEVFELDCFMLYLLVGFMFYKDVLNVIKFYGKEVVLIV